MSCNHCTTKFNFFHKEVGCSNCGLSFCNKCLRQKCRIPSKGPGEYTVCKLCYSKLAAGTSSTTNVVSVQPPDIFYKRLENLENPVAAPITIYKNNTKLQSLKQGLSATDLQLLERLEKLKDSGKGPPPTEWELRKRLATLQGINNYVEVPTKHTLAPVDTRTDSQKTDALLQEFMTEREIELSQNPQVEIEARLASLRGKGIRPNEGSYITNLHDSSNSSEDEVDKIARKIMDEVALEEKTAVTADSIDDRANGGRAGSPELPWCVLCNNDARWRCEDCGGDLYCHECNREVHKNWGDTDHKVTPFNKS